MQIQDIGTFLEYLDKVHQLTLRLVRCIPHDKLDWSYAPGEFPLGDLVRHIACIERHMYAENVQGKPSRYAGCGKELADGYNQVVQFMEDMHRESVEIFSRLESRGPESQVRNSRRRIHHGLEMAARHG
jgi:hypothetical protein